MFNYKNLYQRTNDKMKAFTLSEVLITLVVIGIVAAITVPIMFANYQKEVTKSALKKNQSVIAQALRRFYIENGENLYYSDYGARELIVNLKQYFSFIKDCGFMGCYYDNLNEYMSYTREQKIDYHYFDDGQLILTDGTFLAIENPESGETTFSRKKFISVDINGLHKKPNQLGKDLFMFEIGQNGDVIPMGAKGTTYEDYSKYCSSTSSDKMNGAACTNKVLNE